MIRFEPMRNTCRAIGRSLAVAAIVLALAACADTPGKRDPGSTLAQYRQFAGAPVDSMPFIRLDSWQPLDDEHLVVWTNPREAYLLTIWPNCDWMTIAPAIGLTSSVHTVYRNIDKVIVPSRLNARFPNQECPISEIRPIDLAAYKKARAAERAAQSRSGT